MIRLGTGDRGSIPDRARDFVFYAPASRRALGPIRPSNQWVLGALSPGIKWPGREVYYSRPTSTEVKNAWSYTSTPPVGLHSVMLI
jgi:hypothetical protein